MYLNEHSDNIVINPSQLAHVSDILAWNYEENEDK